VLDPFSGSATTLAVAKKLGRSWLGFDLSPDYVKRGTARLAEVHVGDQLDGAPEPTMSAPNTASGRRLDDKDNGVARKRRPTAVIARVEPSLPLFDAARPRPAKRPAKTARRARAKVR